MKLTMKWATILTLISLIAPVNLGAVGESSLKGFSQEHAKWQQEYERRLLALPQPAECDALLRELTRRPHLAGTENNARVTQFIADEYRKAGLEVEVPSYDVLLSYPKSALLEIIGEPEVKLGSAEPAIESDPDTVFLPTEKEMLLPWNAYAPSCDLESEVIYVNHGSAADYDQLARMGISVKGKIALARYFGGYRGGKSLEAEKRGVAAMLVYSDPIDDGWFKGEVYPAGPWGSEAHFQRGANVYDFLIPGDPLTPGWPSTPGAPRIAESESTVLPKVPMMPLSARDAGVIMRRLTGPAVPAGWQGVAMPATYHIGPGPARVHLKIENTREVRKIYNVIGVLKGTDEPERKIYLSNHHDAWVYGAVDPSSGTASLISLARALGRLAREGWRPRRTIVFASWDAEEYTLTGSTEWGEEHENELKKNAVVCINVDASVSGKSFSASASPLLFEAIRDVARTMDDPGAAGKKIADTWRDNAGKTNIRSYASGASKADELPVSILGSGSDYTVFFNHCGVPSADLIFDGPYGVYHSVYDDYQWMASFGDPGFVYHAGMAKYVGVLALRFANADLLPFEAAGYGREIAHYCEELSADARGKEFAAELGELVRAARAWSAQAGAAQQAAENNLQTSQADTKQVKAVNDWLLNLERALLDDEGLPERPWFRHLIYAPLPSYEAETLPAIRESIEAAKADRAKAQISKLTAKLAAALVEAQRVNNEIATRR